MCLLDQSQTGLIAHHSQQPDSAILQVHVANVQTATCLLDWSQVQSRHARQNLVHQVLQEYDVALVCLSKGKEFQDS